MLKQVLEKIAIAGRPAPAERHLDVNQLEKLQHLREHGYVMLDKFVETERLARLQQDYHERLEQNLEVELPCLAQAKIDPEEHADLIKNNFLATPGELEQLGLTFNRADIENYQQVVEKFAPSTLTMRLPDNHDFFDMWLDPDVIAIVQSYLGFTPLLTEAYIRRNFPARHKVMNHAWHRDRNHDKYLLKGFIFLSDCTLRTGPHHYISGSIQDRTLDGKPYFTDTEVETAYPESSGRHIISVVKAGTIVLEDTRGLHKAGVPDEGFRDLGFAVFTPPVAFRAPKPLFGISRSDYAQLNTAQQNFIPRDNIN